ncbi:MAG: aminotransferase class I/II-fold pyridoxal phosphate-dependent enzyme [Eubacteriales bacterium]
MKISSFSRSLAAEAEINLKDTFDAINARARANTEHVLDCFRSCEVSESYFTPSTGYGSGDRGRDALDRLAAEIFRAPAAFIRPSLLSGTHTLTVALFGILRPGDIMLSVTGSPYDTLTDVLGTSGSGGEQNRGSISSEGSLADFGVKFEKIELKPDAFNEEQPIDTDAMCAFLREHGEKVKMVYVQRSRGYAFRPALTCSQIRKAAYLVRKTAQEMGIRKPVFMVDNCYGEFVEETEPCYVPFGAENEAPADIIAGSLIKNPGGGMADIGGYIAGGEECIRLCGNRLTAPGVGAEIGASLGQNRNMIKGLFYAPHTVAEALKTACLTAYLFEKCGFEVSPKWDGVRSDIVQIVKCGTAKNLLSFCQGIQSASPIDSFVLPCASDMPGYADEVVMAAGAFVGGSSIELSADGPMRPPFYAYMQGGLTYESSRLAIMSALDKMLEK